MFCTSFAGLPYNFYVIALSSGEGWVRLGIQLPYRNRPAWRTGGTYKPGGCKNEKKLIHLIGCQRFEIHIFQIKNSILHDEFLMYGDHKILDSDWVELPSVRYPRRSLLLSFQRASVQLPIQYPVDCDCIPAGDFQS